MNPDLRNVEAQTGAIDTAKHEKVVPRSCKAHRCSWRGRNPRLSRQGAPLRVHQVQAKKVIKVPSWQTISWKTKYKTIPQNLRIDC